MQIITDIFQHKAVLKVGGILSIVGMLFGDYYYFFVAFFILNVVDYITGMVKARMLNEASSNIGAKGIAKKAGYWIIIGLSFLVSVSCVEMGKLIDTNLGFLHLFGYFILATYIVNEIRSIVENIIEMDVYVPPVFRVLIDFLAKGLEVAASKNLPIPEEIKEAHTD